MASKKKVELCMIVIIEPISGVDDPSGSEIEEATDEDEAAEKDAEDEGADEALTKQYRQEVDEESSSDSDADDTMDQEKKKLAKEKVCELRYQLLAQLNP